MEKDSLKERYHELQSLIDGATANQVQFLAVSKAQPFEKIEELYRLGHRDFGENYVQELVEKNAKAQELGLKDIRWHFIGHLQKNKVKQVLPIVKSIHSIDSIELAIKIEEVATLLGVDKIPCYIQVNIDGEESKHGFIDIALQFMLPQLIKLPHLQIEGLMCIPRANRSGVVEPFRKMRALLSELRMNYGNSIGPGLSMGMSEDFEEAIQEGATVVRIGSSLFGARS